MRVLSITVAVALAGIVAAPLACKKDEPPPPLPSAAPAATPTPTAPVELAPEPVAPAASDAGAPKKVTGGGGGSSLKKCCAALRQNAASAPEPNKTYMLNAAGMCDGMAASGQTGSIAGAIQGMLRGAGMPSACQ
jgi:hypothetical protein